MGKWDKDALEENIADSPWQWKDALTQGSTGEIAVPTPTQHDNIIKQARALTSVYGLLGGFTITSWLRTVEHNKAVGGAATSMHLTGLATDFVPHHGTPDSARAKIKAANIYPGRTEIDALTWIHLDLKNNIDFYGRPKK